MGDISVLFSGGPDSTLAALYALDRAERVHLLTYHHRYMGDIGKHRKVLAEMRERFGESRVIAREVETDRSFKRFYTANMRKKLPKYRTYYIPWICGACKMAMHAATIQYNREHGIDTTFDGAHSESSGLFPAQMDTYIAAMSELYRSYGMTYDTPVYNVQGTDIEAAARGIETLRDTKSEHVIFSTQHTCFVGLLIHAHARLYYKPFRGRERVRSLSGDFLRRAIDECREWLPQPVSGGTDAP